MRMREAISIWLKHSQIELNDILHSSAEKILPARNARTQSGREVQYNKTFSRNEQEIEGEIISRESDKSNQ